MQGAEYARKGAAEKSTAEKGKGKPTSVPNAEILSPLNLMYTMFAGFAISLGYGLSASLLLYLIHGFGDAQLFFKAYTLSFHTVFSLGLILGTALIVGRTQLLIPKTIEGAFKSEQLKKTRYPHFKACFADRQQSMIWSSELALVSFLVFLLCEFPLPFLAENLMILAACAEYAFGVYVGRKLFYSALMLESLLEIKVNKNLFKTQKLNIIDEYVHIASTLTFVFGAIHLHNYYFGPFSFQGVLGESARVLVLFPAIIGTPVLLIFNFYPRRVLRRIYSQSIDVEIRNLKRRLSNQSLDTLQRMSYLIEFEKQSRDELRYRLRLTLADLPIGITLLIMLLASLLRSGVRLGP